MANTRKAKKVMCIETGMVYNSYNEAGRAIGASVSLISKVVSGEIGSAKGFHFEVVEEKVHEEVEVPLTVPNEQGEPIPVIDSREVAKMMGTTHSNIMMYIEGNESCGVIGIAEVIENIGTTNCIYFIPSTYLANNRKCKCYLVTKQGCELLGNKQQGEKGILFSLAYVERFNEMEKELKNNSISLSREDELLLAVVKGATPLDRATAVQQYTELITDKVTAPLKATIEEQDTVLQEQQPKVELADERLALNGCISITDANKTFGLERGKLMQWARNKGFVDKRKYIKEVNQAGRKYFKVYQNGEYRNIGITEEGMKLIKENKEEINSVKLTRNVQK